MKSAYYRARARCRFSRRGSQLPIRRRSDTLERRNYGKCMFLHTNDIFLMNRKSSKRARISLPSARHINTYVQCDLVSLHCTPTSCRTALYKLRSTKILFSGNTRERKILSRGQPRDQIRVALPENSSTGPFGLLARMTTTTTTTTEELSSATTLNNSWKTKRGQLGEPSMVMMAVRTPGYRLISELAVHAAERREEGRAGRAKCPELS